MPDNLNGDWRIMRIWLQKMESLNNLEYEISLTDLFRMHEALDIEVEAQQLQAERMKRGKHGDHR